MTTSLVGIISIILLLFFISIGLSIGINLILISIIGSVLIIGFEHTMPILGETMFYALTSPSFSCLPLFILMGAFAARAGFAKKAFDTVYKFFSNVPGSLAIATSYGCALFGAVSASSLATAAVFGKIVLPEMKRYKYDKSFSLGTIASSGTFACMIPPGSLFIVYAIFTDVSIGKLFLAGIFPGLMTATVYTLSIIFRVKRNPKLAPTSFLEKQFTLKEKVMSIKQVYPIALLAFVILGGIYGGIFTPTEAGAAGALGAFVLGLMQGKLRNFNIIKDALREAANTTAMIFIIMIGALYASRFLALTQIPVKLSNYVTSLDVPRIFVLSSILILWFLLGMIINPTGIFALTLPIVFPLIVDLGYDPVWFGVMTIKLSEIAAVTPPVGINVYTLKGVAGKDTTIEEIFRGIWPYVVCDVIMVILLILFPGIATFLPGMIK